MEQTTKKIVWLIEDRDDDAEEAERLLEQDGVFDVIHVNLRPKVEDYEDLLADPNTGALIIDQRLSDYGGVPYDGVQVANYLRVIRPEIPIFILTHYATDVAIEQGEGSVDAVLDKHKLNRLSSAYAARINRSLQRYDEALTNRQGRVKELIDKKLNSELSKRETDELNTLRAEIIRANDLVLDEKGEEKNREIEAQEELITRLEELVSKISTKK